jgi:hypothetical protein
MMTSYSPPPLSASVNETAFPFWKAVKLSYHSYEIIYDDTLATDESQAETQVDHGVDDSVTYHMSATLICCLALSLLPGLSEGSALTGIPFPSVPSSRFGEGRSIS